MSRKKKTPPFLIELIRRHEELVEWIEQCMHTKTTTPIECQANVIQEQTTDHMLGRINGAIATLEDALHAYGCYRGFRYVARPVMVDGQPMREFVGLDDPRFKEYRRRYMVG